DEPGTADGDPGTAGSAASSPGATSSPGGAAGQSGAEPGPSPTTPAGVTEEQLMMERVLLLQGYIETHALEHYFEYPKVKDVREGGALRARLWPDDPWTGEALRRGTTPGRYTYTVAADRRSYRLVGHLPDGDFEVRGAMPHTGLTAYRHREQEGLSLIRQYVIEWARRHDGLYPPASQVSREGGVGALRDDALWPSNPWNHGPMIQSDAVGDFSYEVAADRTSCRLSLHTTPTDDWTLDCDPLEP
ncbi:MAG TPA: hypothetical protein VLA35_09220, partial [Thermoleophilia bacterium]|nr:hypothetical protein [Thermoleophilia bacterium]